jgi:alpha-1,3-glucan synthase
MPSSGNVTTETSIWSVLRSQFEGAQDLLQQGGQGKQPIWLVYNNDNDTITYKFDYQEADNSFLAAFSDGTTVKNLFYLHDR